MKYALDTNTLSYFFRGEGHVGQRLRLVRPADIGIPAPVLHESRYGILRLGSSARQTALLAALDLAIETLHVVNFDAKAAEAAARIRTQLERVGMGIGPLEVQIAGIALAQDLTLVTRNVREFSRVESLRLENWYDAVA